MAYQNMVFELVGDIAGLPFPRAQTLINEALGRVYDESDWSFQMLEAGWLTPGLLFSSGNNSTQSIGTITVTPYSNIVTGDVDASAVWAAYNGAGKLPLLTQLQIRSPYFSLYNIVAYAVVGGFGRFTLDRPWMEPGGAGTAYMIYQAYYPVPGTGFKRFFAVRDTTNNAPLDYWSTGQKDLMVMDPQRTNFDQPAYVVPYEVDKRAGSATLGQMLFELWPHPLSVLPYTIAFMQRGPLLVNPGDTVPYPLTEELVKWRGREVAYLWKESQKGDGIARGNGADFRFLSQAAHAEYARELKIIRDRDRDQFDLYYTRFVRDAALGWTGLPFSTITGQLNVGR